MRLSGCGGRLSVVAVATANRRCSGDAPLPCLVKLPVQGVCVGLLLPPLDAAHAELQQLGAVWGCWMWCTRHLAV